jgi:hypothetical protein
VNELDDVAAGGVAEMNLSRFKAPGSLIPYEAIDVKVEGIVNSVKL